MRQDGRVANLARRKVCHRDAGIRIEADVIGPDPGDLAVVDADTNAHHAIDTVDIADTANFASLDIDNGGTNEVSLRISATSWKLS